MNKNFLKKAFVTGIILAVCVLYKYYGLNQYLSLESLKIHQNEIHDLYLSRPMFLILSFVSAYIIAVAFSFPGASIFTLAAGAIFGFGVGTVIVSISSTIGATLAFLATRYLFKNFVQEKFRGTFESINAGIEKEGVFYLFTLRLIPIFPFFLINLLMGLTPIRTFTYFWVSMLGMLPGTMVYINAGTQLSKINSLKGILSPEIIFSLVLMGIVPIISKFIINQLKLHKYSRSYKKPKKYDYNMVVIGGGSAGLVSSYIAAAVKAKVVLIEKHKMGGDCLNTGCVPSKALIRSAKILNYFKRSKEFGFESVDVQVNFSKIMDRVKNIVAEVAPHDSIERYTELGVECITGTAKIISPYEVEVNGKILRTKNIVVATGARPFVPPIPGLSDVEYLTSDNLWELKNLPKKFVVLGGGPIGCEIAQSFARFGSTVTQVEMTSTIMGREDTDVSDFVTAKFKSEGIDVLTNHKANRVIGSDKILICEHKGKEVKIEFDAIFIALGRRANISGFGLEELKVEISKVGTIVADEFLRTTNYPNIYVCGDVTGPFQFTHTAAHQAWYVAVNALFNPLKKFKVDYKVIPWCTFIDPEVARVGLSEREAIDKKIPYQLSKYGIDDLDRAITESENHGFVKVLTTPGTDKIIGATIVGNHAGDIIGEYVTAMKYNLGMNKILGTIHIYPTFLESNKYAAGVWKKQNAPLVVLNLLRKFHTWRRG